MFSCSNYSAIQVDWAQCSSIVGQPRLSTTNSREHCLRLKSSFDGILTADSGHFILRHSPSMHSNPVPQSMRHSANFFKLSKHRKDKTNVSCCHALALTPIALTRRSEIRCSLQLHGKSEINIPQLRK